jgi:hypothetical protein
VVHETSAMYECVRHIPFLFGERKDDLARVLATEDSFLGYLTRKLPKHMPLLRQFVAQDPKDRPKISSYETVRTCSASDARSVQMI